MRAWRVPVALCAALIAGGVPAAGGADPPELTLEDAVRMALAQSHTLGIADAELRAATAEVDRARAPRLPRLDLEETYSRTTNPAIVFSNLLGQEAFGPENFEIDRLNEPDALSNFHTRAVVTWPLYAGGSIASGIAASELTLGSKESARERTRQEVVRQVIDAYAGAVLARNQLGVARAALETARANVTLVRDLHEAGLVVASDLLQARLHEREVRELEIRAESGVAVSEAALNLALGRDLGTPVALPGTLPEPDPATESLEVLLEESRTSRPDLRAAEQAVDAAEQELRGARAPWLPDVGISGAVEANEERYPGTGGTNWSVMVGARLTVFDGGATSAAVRGARERRDVAARARDLRREIAALEVRRAFHELRAASARLEESRGGVELAGESLRIVGDRYREGLTTLVELLDAEAALTRARTREIAAHRDVLVGDADLKLAVGRWPTARGTEP